MNIIFDLDQTLINTTALKPYRDKHLWKAIPQHLNETFLYTGIKELLEIIHEKNIPFAIVTNSPKFYAKNLLSYFSISENALVAYHDTQKHKPHPEPMLVALSLLNSKETETISLGDSAKDIISSQKAGITSCAALWGSDNISELQSSNPNYEFSTPQDFSKFILSSLKQ